MAIRKPDQREKDEIRSAFERAIEEQATKEQIAELRKNLADRFHLTLQQVSSICAWKRNPNGEKLSLEPTKVNQEAKDVPHENDENSELTNDQEEVEDLTSFRKSPISTHRKSGAWTDYEHSQVKEKWRTAEMAIFDKHRNSLLKPPEELQVLCTPGIKCHMEVKRLLERGIRPENILAVERVRGAWSEFESNCKALGIVPRFGELKEVLPKLRTKFDVVLLDFLGQYCLSNQEIVYQIPLENRAMIAINMGGKREKKDVQKAMQKEKDTARNVTADMIETRASELLRDAIDCSNPNIPIDERRARWHRLWKQAYEDVKGQLDNRDITVNDDLRDQELDSLVHCAGIGRSDHWTFPKLIQNIPQMFDPEKLKELRREEFNQDFIALKNFWTALDLCERGVFAPFKYALRGSGPLGKQISQKIAPLVDMTGRAAVGHNLVTHLAKYKYFSRVSETPNPFLTTIAFVECPKDVYRKQQPAAHFFAQLTKEAAQDQKDKKERKYNFSVDGDKVSVKKLEDNGSQRSLAGINISQLLEAMQLYEEQNNKYPLNDYEQSKKIERELLG
jgi:hypothetical protein